MIRAPLRGLAIIPKVATAPLKAWQPLPAPPRMTPFAKGLRGAPGWEWRALPCEGNGHRFLLFGTVNIRLGQYRAWLLHHQDDDFAVLARLEDHGDHPGLHLHAWCPGPLPPAGTPSINAPRRFMGKMPRRTAQQKGADSFWGMACGILRIKMPPASMPIQGSLL